MIQQGRRAGRPTPTGHSRPMTAHGNSTKLPPQNHPDRGTLTGLDAGGAWALFTGRCPTLVTVARTFGGTCSAGPFLGGTRLLRPRRDIGQSILLERARQACPSDTATINVSLARLEGPACQGRFWEGPACRVRETPIDNPLRFIGHDKRASPTLGRTRLSAPAQSFRSTVAEGRNRRLFAATDFRKPSPLPRRVKRNLSSSGPEIRCGGTEPPRMRYSDKQLSQVP